MNKFEKILLVNFYYVLSGYGPKLNYPPLSIGYIAENLEYHGFSTAIMDLHIHEDLDSPKKDLNQKILEFKPDIVGFSLNSININKSLEIIKFLKDNHKDIKIIVGGPHASSKQMEILEQNSYIDYISIHEGENTLKELMFGIDKSKIKGLGFRKDKEIFLNPSETIQNINDIKWPKYANFDMNNYLDKDAIGILTSRGCPYLCGFCQQSSLIGKKWRGRTPENVVEEIDYWDKAGKKKIYIIDDMFLMDKKRVIEISNLVCKNNLNHLEYVSVGGFRVNHCDYETLSALKEMGVKAAAFGIESGSDRVLKFIKKNISRDKIEKVISDACNLNFKIKLFFIIGLPTQTKAEMEESFELALKFEIAQVRFFNYVPYDDTFLMNWLLDNDAKFFFEYNEYMENFKKYQDIPIFEEKIGMTKGEKIEMILKAREIESLIEKRAGKYGL